MCFIIHLASKTPPILVSREEPPAGTALQAIRPGEQPICDKFTLPHVAEIKLATGCGCWLRYVDDPEPETMAACRVGMPDYDPSIQQPNHDSLADYLHKHFQQDGLVEFFGYFDGDASQRTRAHQTVAVDAICHPHFHFHAGTLYRLVFA